MKIKEGFILRHVGDQIIVVAVGSASQDFNGIIRMNSTGEFLWKQLTSDVTKEQLLASLLVEYNITEPTAAYDLTSFLMKLKGAKLLEE